jgi:peroxin-19
MMHQMLSDNEGGGGSTEEDEFLGRFMQEMQSQLKSEIERMEETEKRSADKQNNVATGTESKKSATASAKTSSPSGKEAVEEAISSLVDDMAKQASIDEPSFSAAAGGSEEERMLNSLMEGLAGISGGSPNGGGDAADVNADALIDGMMEQLMSKDLMYEPMKQIARAFPEWLEERRNALSPEEYRE